MSDTMTTEQQWKELTDHMLLAPIVAYDMMTASLAGLFEDAGFVERLKEKFEQGSKIHDGAWMTMSPEDLINEANEEILDLWIYILMFAYRSNQIANPSE